jgi:uncharacterized protein YlxW (UPF0749 family)
MGAAVVHAAPDGQRRTVHDATHCRLPVPFAAPQVQARGDADDAANRRRAELDEQVAGLQQQVAQLQAGCDAAQQRQAAAEERCQQLHQAVCAAREACAAKELGVCELLHMHAMQLVSNEQ